MPCSLPFLTPSEQLGAMHLPPMQTWLRQSPGTVHPSPVAHRSSQSGPPQSLAVSFPFLTLSVHDGAMHRSWLCPAGFAQTPLTQSVSPPHFLPSLHGAHAEPPQSTSVSEPSGEGVSNVS